MAAPHVLVVGAGDCGTRAALRLRELDPDVRVTLVGDETDDPYERPGLSKSVLTDPAGAPTAIATRQRLEDAGVVWQSGVRAIAVDSRARRVALSDDRAVRYDRLLLATGARARRMAIPGADSTISVRSLGDARSLRSVLRPGSRLLVIGGGFIGLEVAASARRIGLDVTVLEFAYELMSRVVPVAIGRAIRARHLAEGVDLRLGVEVEQLTRDNAGVTAVLDDGTRVHGDVVVAGVGAIPNTELAATCGLPISNGIAVDEYLCTTDPRIFAAGDCCSVPHPLYDGARVRLEAWRNALAQADVVARNMLGERVSYDVVPSFWSDQYELTLQVVGLHTAAVAEIVRRRSDGAEIRFGLDASGRLVSASGVSVGTALARELRMAEMLIAGRVRPDLADLANPDIGLRSLL